MPLRAVRTLSSVLTCVVLAASPWARAIEVSAPTADGRQIIAVTHGAMPAGELLLQTAGLMKVSDSAAPVEKLHRPPRHGLRACLFVFGDPVHDRESQSVNVEARHAGACQKLPQETGAAPCSTETIEAQFQHFMAPVV